MDYLLVSVLFRHHIVPRHAIFFELNQFWHQRVLEKVVHLILKTSFLFFVFPARRH